MNLHLFDDVPAGLTLRARSYLSAHGVKVDTSRVEQHRQSWLDQEVPAAGGATGPHREMR
ncbi:hypothetical protein ACFZAU_04580 [Streptomyces sp. NPDC008238]